MTFCKRQPKILNVVYLFQAVRNNLKIKVIKLKNYIVNSTIELPVSSLIIYYVTFGNKPLLPRGGFPWFPQDSGEYVTGVGDGTRFFKVVTFRNIVENPYHSPLDTLALLMGSSKNFCFSEQFFLNFRRTNFPKKLTNALVKKTTCMPSWWASVARTGHFQCDVYFLMANGR